MENTTSRLAIEIEKLPPFPFDWNDKTPQKDRHTLKEDDILASEEEGIILHKRMVVFISAFLVDHFTNLKDLKQFLPATKCERKRKSTVLPMKILFEDESRTDDNIHILHQLIHDANLSGEPQVSILFSVLLLFFEP